MNKLMLLVVAMLLCGIDSAVAQDVRYDFDKTKDFSTYKTYRWVPIKGEEQLDQLTTMTLVAAIDAGLSTKGLSKTDSDAADLYVGFQTAISTEKQYTSYDLGWGYGPGWGGRWYGYGGGMSTTYGSTSTIYIGQLDLSIYDSKEKQLVWRGSVSKTIDTKAKPEKKEKNIAKATAKLLKNYPPPKPKG